MHFWAFFVIFGFLVCTQQLFKTVLYNTRQPTKKIKMIGSPTGPVPLFGPSKIGICYFKFIYIQHFYNICFFLFLRTTFHMRPMLWASSSSPPYLQFGLQTSNKCTNTQVRAHASSPTKCLFEQINLWINLWMKTELLGSNPRPSRLMLNNK